MARRALENRVVLVDSITELTPDDDGYIVVSGSHGGVSAARFAALVQAQLFVFNDAGVGKDAAGTAGLTFLQDRQMAGCCVDTHSARIGDALDTLNCGVVSACNPIAAALGVCVGMTIDQVIARLRA